MQPDATAVRFLGHTTTWGDLDRRVSALAGALSRRGVEFGDRVLILMLNRTEFIESLLAANLLGAIAVPVNFRMTPAEIAFLVGDCEAKVVVTESVLAGVATAVRDLDSTLATVIVAGGATEDGVLGYEDLLAEDGDPPPPVDIPNDSPALIMYTSGTTGRPKGAVLTHNNIAGQGITGLFTIGVDLNNDVGFIGVPLFHIAGIGNVIGGLMLGRPTVLYPLGGVRPRRTARRAGHREGDRHLPGARAVAGGVRGAARQPARRPVAGAVVGRGARIGHASARHGRNLPRHQIFAAFGQTEMSPVTCMLLGEDAIRKLGSVGKVIPTVAARVVDEDMNDVPVGQVGEIVYRAPTLMAGYWNNPKATAEAFAGGWFHSGDLVRQDDEGYVWVVDRKKDMIISGGENIYCAEVENALADHPAIAEVAVIGRAHREMG